MKKKIIIFSLLILIVAVIGSEKIEIYNKLKMNNEFEISKDEEVKQVYDNKFEDIVEILNVMSAEHRENIGIYYYNFDTDESYGVNEDIEFVSASLKKLAMVMQILDKVQAGEFSLDTEIEYMNKDYADGTGTLQFEEVISKRTIKELVNLSIVESDNIAYNMLNRVCDYTLLDYISNILEESIAKDEYPKLTAKQTFKLLNRLYTNPTGNEYYEEVLELMKITAFNDRLDKNIPTDKVAHKIGSYFRYYHDAGIIYAKETYALVILTKDIGELSNDPKYTKDQEERHIIDWGEEANNLIASISEKIYNTINK